MRENLFVLIEMCRSDFTEVEHIIGGYFLAKQPPESIEVVAQALSVSKASITRFCKKIGLNNYKELIFLYKTSLKNDEQGSIVSNVLAAYHNLVTRSEQVYSAKAVRAFCELIHYHKIIHFYGKGFNAYVGMDFQFKFSRIGKYVRVISDEKSINLSADFAKPAELIVVATLRGHDEQLLHALDKLQQAKLPIVLLTANQRSPLIKFADVVLFTAGFTREETFGNISPQIPMLMQLDMVYESYIHLYTDLIKQWVASEQILHQETREKDA